MHWCVSESSAQADQVSNAKGKHISQLHALFRRKARWCRGRLAERFSICVRTGLFHFAEDKKKYTLYDIALVCPVNLNPISAASILVHGHTCGRWWNEIEHSTIIFIGFYVTRWEESEWLEWRRCLCGYFCGGLCFRSFCYIVMPRFVSCPPSPGKQNVFDLDYRSDLRVLDTIVSTEFDECDTVKRWFLPAETLIQYWERVQRLNNKHQVEKVFSWQHGCETEKE